MATVQRAEKRLARELQMIHKDPPPNIKLISDGSFKNIRKWLLSLTGVKNTLYEDEVYRISIVFGARYPFEAPMVVFKGEPPIHPHIYSNGHICLSILTEDWSPAFTVRTICLSILSMLSSAKKKVRPQGNDQYVKFSPDDPRVTEWYYDDNDV